MANTYELIASSTVGVLGASSIDFTSIPNTYTDLVIKLSARTLFTGTSDDVLMKFNGSSSGYSNRQIYGTGSSAGSNAPFTTGIYAAAPCGSTATANTFGNAEIYIPNYAGSNYKSVSSDTVCETNATANLMNLIAGLWSNTAAITSISLVSYNSSNFVQYSTAYLYGVKNA